ncbi:MAG: ankyrin repeat domain-containing protein [Fimbriimonadales bacterium]
MNETDSERPKTAGGLPALVRFLIFLAAVAAVIVTLSRLKTMQRSADPSSPAASEWRYGTRDPILQIAFASNDVPTIRRRLPKTPRSEIKSNVVDVLASGPLAGSLDEVLSAGWDPSGVRRDNGPLAEAISRGDVRMIEVFLRHSVSPNAPGPGGHPVLFGSTDSFYESSHWAETVKYLLDHGANPNIDDKRFRRSARRGINSHWITRPLVEAAKLGDYDVVKLLLEHGADPNWATSGYDPSSPFGKEAGPPLIFVRRFANSPQLTKLLLDHGANPNASGSVELGLPLSRSSPPLRFERVTATCLYFYAQEGDVESVKLLLSRGANPHSKASNGKTVLEAANGDALVYLRQYLKG